MLNDPLQYHIIVFGKSRTYLSSPTTMNGSLLLNAIRVRRADFFGTTCCTQIGLYLLTFMSNTNTLPSDVSAAKTVLEYGAHFTSPTLDPRSKINNGSLKVDHFLFVVFELRRLLKWGRHYLRMSSHILTRQSAAQDTNTFELYLLKSMR